MPRYLTFDEKTASTLREQVSEQQVFHHGAESAVDYALGSERDMVTVMPTGAASEAAIAVFRRTRQAATRASAPVETRPPLTPTPPNVQSRKPIASVPAPEPRASVRAGGFLGLRDEAVFEEEPGPLKKQSWWRKFWPEDE